MTKARTPVDASLREIKHRLAALDQVGWDLREQLRQVEIEAPSPDAFDPAACSSSYPLVTLAKQHRDRAHLLWNQAGGELAHQVFQEAVYLAKVVALVAACELKVDQEFAALENKFKDVFGAQCDKMASIREKVSNAIAGKEFSAEEEPVPPLLAPVDRAQGCGP